MRVPLAALSAALVLSACVAVPVAPANGASCPVVSPVDDAVAPPVFDEGPTISADALRGDFDGWLVRLEALHPDLGGRADLARLAAEAARTRSELTRPMTRREAWTVFSRLNPFFRDGHVGLFMPGYRARLEEHIAARGRAFPLELRFDRDGALRVLATPDPGIPQGSRIVAINGRDADEITAAMLERAPGDTALFRRAWTARRFASVYWQLHGDTTEYRIAYARPDGCAGEAVVAGARSLPLHLRDAPRSADLFAYRVEGDIGYLRLDSFEGPHADHLERLSQEAFAAFRRDGVRALVVDLRENGGGDDPPWQQFVMNHITAEPYAQLSRYAVRITPENADPGDVVGEVQRSDYDDRFVPPVDDPLRFGGPVYILVGPYTYSAAIQFVVAAQDYGIARIAGEETGALSCQTGQTRPIAMPATGLQASSPIIAFTRPSGSGCTRGVLPEVEIATDEVFPERTLARLIEVVRGELREAETAAR